MRTKRKKEMKQNVDYKDRAVRGVSYAFQQEQYPVKDEKS